MTDISLVERPCWRCGGVGLLEGHDVKVTKRGLRVRQAVRACPECTALNEGTGQ